MARHSHWHSIRLKKGAEDQRRGKIFTRHARLIALTASKGGGDPSMNPLLRMAIDNARLANMPKDNIERAIKKGTGEDKEASRFSEVLYEGYGPFGAAILISTVTDNKNRTLQNVKHILNEYGGNLGTSGSTAFLFEKKGMIRVKGSKNKEEDELRIIDSGAEDFEEADAEFLVYTEPLKFSEVKKKLEDSGFEIKSAEISFEPKTPLEIAEPDKKQKIISLLEALEDLEDVLNVATNVLL